MLLQIRQDLDAVRARLLRPSSSLDSSAQMIGHLESAVRGLEDWIRQFPASGGDRRIAVSGLTDLQTQLRQIEPLFENARKLQAGWYSLASAGDETGPIGYDGSGSPAQMARAASAASIEEAG